MCKEEPPLLFSKSEVLSQVPGDGKRLANAFDASDETHEMLKRI
jgi:hypothetical protein